MLSAEFSTVLVFKGSIRGKWKRRKRKAETESWNGNRELKREMVVNSYILLLYAMIVDPIELDLSPGLINVNEPILLGKLITII